MDKQELMPKFIELSKRYGVDINEVDRFYNFELAKLADSKDIPEENRWLSAWLKTQLMVETKYGKKPERDTSTPKSEPGDLEGFIIGSGDYRDRKAQMLKFVEKYVKDNGKTKAQHEGLIKTDGVSVIPLDYRKDVFGKPNPKYGEPLSEAKIDTEMKLYCVLRRVATKTPEEYENPDYKNPDSASEEPFVYATLETHESGIANSWFKSLKFPEHLFVPMKTNGNIREVEMGFKVTASTAEDKVTKFTIDKNPTYDVDKAFMEAIGPLITPWRLEGDDEGSINPLHQHYLDSLDKSGKPDWNRMLFVKGVVDSIRPEWANFKGTPAYICNEDDVVQRVKCFLPTGFEKMFGEGSVVVAYGKDEETMKKNDDTGEWNVPTGRIELRCVGVYPVPGFKMAPQERTNVKIKEFSAWDDK